MWYNKEILREWVGDKKELHLLSLGQLGTLTEMIDGTQLLEIKMSDDNKIDVSHDLFLKLIPKREAFELIENLVRSELFEHFLKIKKKYGAFRICGRILHVEDDWFDEDNTVTINATKYHKVMLGKHGAVFINSITFDKEINEVDKDDILQRLKLIFTINKHIGFTCFLEEDLIPTKEHDVCSNVDVDDFMKSITKLARGKKSVVNGKIDVKDCVVKGYRSCKENLPSSVICYQNDLWEEKVAQNTKKWIEVINYFHKLVQENNLRDLTEDDLEQFVQKCRDFLYDDTLPKGVRKHRVEIADEMLMKLSKKVKDFIYLKYYGELITPPTD